MLPAHLTNEFRLHPRVASWRKTALCFAIAGLCLAIIFASTRSVRADGPQANKLEGKAIYDRLMTSTCWIIQGDSSGTGWVIDAKERLVVTNWHVAERKEACQVYFPMRSTEDPLSWEKAKRAYLRSGAGIKAEVIDADFGNDLALLKLESLPEGILALELSPKDAEETARIHTVGAITNGSDDTLWTYTEGKVRNISRGKLANHSQRDQHELQARGIPPDKTQSRVLLCDMHFNSGNSGGPIVDDFGRLVGVVEGMRLGSDPRMKRKTYRSASTWRQCVGGINKCPG